MEIYCYDEKLYWEENKLSKKEPKKIIPMKYCKWWECGANQNIYLRWKKKYWKENTPQKKKKRHKKQVYRYNENFLRRGTIQIEIYDSISF